MIENLYFNNIGTINNNAVKLCNDDFVVSDIDGIRLGAAELAAQSSVYQIGDTIINTKIMPRDITVTLKPLKDKGDYTQIFDKFAKRLGKLCYLIWKDRVTADGIFTMSLEGTMTECDLPMFNKKNELSFTLHCARPLWRGNSAAIQTFTGISTDIIGTAPPAYVNLEVNSCTIPTGSGNKLNIGACTFKAPSTDISGKLIMNLSETTKTLTVAGTSHLETIASPFSVSEIGTSLYCSSMVSGTAQAYTISANYLPRWY